MCSLCLLPNNYAVDDLIIIILAETAVNNQEKLQDN